MSVLAFPYAARPPAVGTGIPIFDRIVIGVDFASASLAAGRWATTAVARHAHAILVHVAPHAASSEHEADASSPDDAERRIAKALAGGLGGFAATLDVRGASTVVGTGFPSRWLGAIAEQSGATLIVLGRRADSARQRVGEPNVFERVARRNAAAVLVVPEGTTEMPHHVIAVVDNGPLSGAVLATADSVAKLHQIPLILMHVVPPASGAYPRVIDVGRRNGHRRIGPHFDDAPAIATAPREATTRLEELVHQHPNACVDRMLIERGDPARQIISVSAELGPTLIVAGKRGADGAPMGSVGSVARALLKSAPLPVLAVDQAT